MVRSLYNELTKGVNKQYDRNFVCRALLQMRHSNNEILIDELKLKIYYAHSKLIVKAVNNFFSLLKTISPEKVLHTQEDIASECYIVLSNCVNNFKRDELKKFYWYLNSSLNRAMYRLYERQYKKHFDLLPNTEDTEMLMLNTGYNDHFDLTEIDLKDFSNLEIEIIKFKFSGEKLSVFLKIMKINNSQFTEGLEGVKTKLTNLYQNEDR